MKQGGTRFGGLGEESRCVNRVTEFTIPHPVVIRFKVDRSWAQYLIPLFLSIAIANFR